MTTQTGLVIRSVIFGEDFVELTYMTMPTDVRAKGALVQSHTITIDANKGDYRQEFDELSEAALALLRDALEDWHSAPALED